MDPIFYRLPYIIMSDYGCDNFLSKKIEIFENLQIIVLDFHINDIQIKTKKK